MSLVTDAGGRLRGELVIETIGSFNARRAANSAAGRACGHRGQSRVEPAWGQLMAIERKGWSLLAFLVVVGAALGLCRPEALAQAKMNPGDELRPLFAVPDDIADGNELAQNSCASCHGAGGISVTAGVPNLAGQRPAYLYLEMKAYQSLFWDSGNRADAQMIESVKFLSDDALVKVAAYYASLDPAPPAETGGPTIVDPVQAGKTAAAACAGCHGEAGVSAAAGIPNLIGEDPQYLVAAMKDYKTGLRKNDTMKAMLAALSEADMNHIALFYALQKPARAQTPAEGDVEAGKASAAACAGCHGDQGVSGNPATPSLAGQDAAYLAGALAGYKDGTRNNETMAGFAASLDEAAMKNLAAYYTGLEPRPVNVSKPLSPNEWARKCDRCHGLNGNSTQPTVPALAAQRMDYLEAILRDYQTGARRNSEMAAMADVLSDDDIKGIAAYYSHEKARAAVFVTVPAK
jgi:cytochrome c553